MIQDTEQFAICKFEKIKEKSQNYIFYQTIVPLVQEKNWKHEGNNPGKINSQLYFVITIIISIIIMLCIFAFTKIFITKLQKYFNKKM